MASISTIPNFDDGYLARPAVTYIILRSSDDRMTKFDTLGEELSSFPCFTIDQTSSTFKDTVVGLENLHHEGIVHRDIKPKGTNKCRMSCVPPWNQCSRWKSTSQLAQARSSLAETFRAFHSQVSGLLRLRRQALA